MSDETDDQLRPHHVIVDVTLRGAVLVHARDPEHAASLVLDQGEGLDGSPPPWAHAWELEDWSVVQAWNTEPSEEL